MTRAGMVSRPRAGYLEREGDVLGGGPVLQQPKILKHDAEPAAEPRDLTGAMEDTANPDTRTSPWVGRCSAKSSRMMVDFPAPLWPVRNTNSPSRRGR